MSWKAIVAAFTAASLIVHAVVIAKGILGGWIHWAGIPVVMVPLIAASVICLIVAYREAMD